MASMKVMVGSTIPAYKAADHMYESVSWLLNARAYKRDAEEAGHKVWFFATFETDGRELEPFKDVLGALKGVSGEFWEFKILNEDKEITSSSRLPRICAGRNLLIERALMDTGTTHVFFVDSDTDVPANSITRLLRLNRPLAGGHVPVYCLGGPVVMEPNVQEHWNTAGFLMAQRDVIRQVRWGIDPDAGRTDDPHYAHMAELLGFGKTWVDHDLIARHRPHKPAPLAPMEDRGHDRKIY